MDNREKSRKIWRALRGIPIVLAADAVVFVTAVLIDARIQDPVPGTLGHAMPAVTILAMLLMAVITALTVLSALFKVAAVMKKSRKEK